MHAHNDRGLALDRNRRYGEAIGAYRKALRYCDVRRHCNVIKRNLMHSYNDRGIRLKARGKYAEAVRDYKLALKYCAAKKDCVVIRGNLRSAKASLEYQRAAEKRRREREAREAREARERKRIEATRKRLASAVEGGDWKTALADQAVLVEKNKNDPGAWKTFAEYLEKAGRLDDAATAMRRAAMLAGGDAASDISKMYRRDAARRAGNGEYKVAIAQQAMALDLRRDDAGLWQGLGDYMAKDGQLDKAATAYRRAHELGGPDPEDKIFALYQADVLTRAGTLKPAGRIKLYQALIEKFPDARANLTRRRLAEELAGQNRTKEADAVLREVARLVPGSAVAGTGQPGGFEKSHGEQGLGPKAGQQVGDAGDEGKGTDALKVGKPGKDLQTAAHHSGTATEASAAGAKAEAMQGFDTAGRRLGGETDVPAVAGVPIRTKDGPAAIPEIPKDIGADIPPAKRKKVAEALAGNKMWKKLADKRKTIETRRAKIAERRKQLESELDSPALAKNAKKKAEIVAEITKSVIEDDKARQALHDVKIGQKTVAETISFDIEIEEEDGSEEADPKQAGELKPATPKTTN